jgi:hypothetical protein
VCDVEDVKALRNLINETLNDQTFPIPFSDSLARVHVKTAEDFPRLRATLRSEDAKVSTWTIGEVKTASFTIQVPSPRHR